MFKLIGDFPDYAIYSDGRVWSNKSNKFLLPYEEMPNGYLYNEVNHKDENKSNNDCTNLEWCTHTYNNNYGNKNTRANDTKQNSAKYKKHMDNLHNQHKKKVFCVETGRVFDSITEAAATIGCTIQNISIVLRGKGNTAKGYHFSYCEEANDGK